MVGGKRGKRSFSGHTYTEWGNGNAVDTLRGSFGLLPSSLSCRVVLPCHKRRQKGHQHWQQKSEG